MGFVKIRHLDWFSVLFAVASVTFLLGLLTIAVGGFSNAFLFDVGFDFIMVSYVLIFVDVGLLALEGLVKKLKHRTHG